MLPLVAKYRLRKPPFGHWQKQLHHRSNKLPGTLSARARWIDETKNREGTNERQ
ncbi:MAG: hypothetical protein QFB89_00645 [Pseudomonadota bacterium]|nr:hypothetical protein [Pseudomonadota bacterium]